MGKSTSVGGKKRRRLSSSTGLHNVDLLCNVTGLGRKGSTKTTRTTMDEDEDEEACLAEMERDSNAVQPPSAAAIAVENNNNNNNNSNLRKKSKLRPTTVTDDHRIDIPTSDAIGRYRTALVESMMATTTRGNASSCCVGGSRAASVLLPNPQVEVSRHIYTQQLSSFLLNQCPSVRMPSFERWWIDSKWEEENEDDSGRSNNDNGDPVIPRRPSLQSNASQRLVEEILYHDDSGMTIAGANTIVQELCLRTTHAYQQVSSIRTTHYRRMGGSTILGKKSRISLNKDGGRSSTSTSQQQRYTLTYTHKSWKKPFSVQINATYYDRLWKAFCHVHDYNDPSLMITTTTRRRNNNNNHRTVVLPTFHVLVFCLLLRYSSLSGGQLLSDLRGGGMQGAIMSEVFDVLKQFFPSSSSSSYSRRQPVVVECFASPWNSHYLLNCSTSSNSSNTMAVNHYYYASAFPDLDGHFGSIGDFREITCVEGVYEVNPPFSPGLMMYMVKRIEADLSRANESSKRLSFLVIVPTVNSTDAADDSTAVPSVPPPPPPPTKRHAKVSFNALIKSPFCRLHIILPSRQHGYVEGAQHLRPTRYKQSPYDTSLILMQSDAAARLEGLDHVSFEKELRRAFASRHEEEIQQRRQQQQNG